MNRQQSDAQRGANFVKSWFFDALRQSNSSECRLIRLVAGRLLGSRSRAILNAWFTCGVISVLIASNSGCCMHLNGPGCRFQGCRRFDADCRISHEQAAHPADYEADIPVSKFNPVPTRNIFLPVPGEPAPLLLNRRLRPLPLIDQSIQLYDLYGSAPSVVEGGQPGPVNIPPSPTVDR